MGLALLPAALLNDPAFINVLRPVLTELPLQEFNLYLLYPGRKFLPFKSRAFIDLVLESTTKGQAQSRPHSPPTADAIWPTSRSRRWRSEAI